MDKVISKKHDVLCLGIEVSSFCTGGLGDGILSPDSDWDLHSTTRWYTGRHANYTEHKP